MNTQDILEQPALPASCAGQDPLALVQAVASAIWRVEVDVTDVKLWGKYLELYKVKLNNIRNGNRHFKPAKHRDVVRLVDLVRENASVKLSDLRDTLRALVNCQWLKCNTEESAGWCLRYAASTWLMTSSTYFNDWQDDQSLQDLMLTRFASMSVPGGVLFTATAQRLRRLANFQVVYTYNIDEHLHFTPQGRILYVFSCQEYFGLAHDVEWLEDLMRDAQSTMLLLFPVQTRRERRWNTYRGHIHPDLELQPWSAQPMISTYEFWGSRLWALQKELDKAEPKTFTQVWHDDRDRNKWYTMWITIVVFGAMTFIFGIIASITGIMQVKKPC